MSEKDIPINEQLIKLGAEVHTLKKGEAKLSGDIQSLDGKIDSFRKEIITELKQVAISNRPNMVMYVGAFSVVIAVASLFISSIIAPIRGDVADIRKDVDANAGLVTESLRLARLDQQGVNNSMSGSLINVMNNLSSVQADHEKLQGLYDSSTNTYDTWFLRHSDEIKSVREQSAEQYSFQSYKMGLLEGHLNGLEESK